LALLQAGIEIEIALGALLQADEERDIRQVHGLDASPEPRYYHNLRVDDHADPVPELRRVYDVVLEHSGQIEREYGSEGLRLFGRVKY